jgi:hypothetical protein
MPEVVMTMRSRILSRPRRLRLRFERRLQFTACVGVRYRISMHGEMSVPMPAREKGPDVEGKVIYEDVTLIKVGRRHHWHRKSRLLVIQVLQLPAGRREVTATQ